MLFAQIGRSRISAVRFSPIVHVLCQFLALVKQAEIFLIDVDVQLPCSLPYLRETFGSGYNLFVWNIHFEVLLNLVRSTLFIDRFQILVLIQLAKYHGYIRFYDYRVAF